MMQSNCDPELEPGLPSWLTAGSVVRRGSGKTLWQVTGLAGGLITLKPVDGYTNASVPLTKADTLSVLTEADPSQHNEQTDADPAATTRTSAP